MFSTCSLLHLPQPTDSASSPSQDRCCLNRCWTKCQRTQEEEGAPVQLLTAGFCKYDWQTYPIMVIVLEVVVSVTRVQGFRWDPNVITILFCSARAIIFCKLLPWETSSCLNNAACLLYFPEGWRFIHDVQWRRDKQAKKKRTPEGL